MTTDIYKKYGAFFAFSNAQFDERKQDNVQYVSFDGGLIIPADNADKFFIELNAQIKTAADKDIAENGIKKIIHRELANHECQISYDYSDVVDALDSYGITEDQVIAEWDSFYQNCIDNDCF